MSKIVLRVLNKETGKKYRIKDTEKHNKSKENVLVTRAGGIEDWDLQLDESYKKCKEIELELQDTETGLLSRVPLLENLRTGIEGIEYYSSFKIYVVKTQEKRLTPEEKKAHIKRRLLGSQVDVKGKIRVSELLSYAKANRGVVDLSEDKIIKGLRSETEDYIDMSRPGAVEKYKIRELKVTNKQANESRYIIRTLISIGALEILEVVGMCELHDFVSIAESSTNYKTLIRLSESSKIEGKKLREIEKELEGKSSIELSRGQKYKYTSTKYIIRGTESSQKSNTIIELPKSKKYCTVVIK